ncbi:hypothetical protein GE061_001930 [Apolygus lucorum]|uniref:Uncharacterized protein n=1 Tax=Apolygus lucorum TaxID=248454 RepID=A0A8S9X5E0_APOLU|nr:hypothetical protein GE061_001930 [Apolygus lucorum]
MQLTQRYAMSFWIGVVTLGVVTQVSTQLMPGMRMPPPPPPPPVITFGKEVQSGQVNPSRGPAIQGRTSSSYQRLAPATPQLDRQANPIRRPAAQAVPVAINQGPTTQQLIGRGVGFESLRVQSTPRQIYRASLNQPPQPTGQREQHAYQRRP